MGWPNSDEQYRIYRERGGSYFLLILEDKQGQNYGAVANVYAGYDPSLCYTSVSENYMRDKGCARVQWDELPLNWQEAFRDYMSPQWEGEPEFNPDKIRGFWRTKSLPNQETQC